MRFSRHLSGRRFFPGTVPGGAPLARARADDNAAPRCSSARLPQGDIRAPPAARPLLQDPPQFPAFCPARSASRDLLPGLAPAASLWLRAALLYCRLGSRLVLFATLSCHSALYGRRDGASRRQGPSGREAGRAKEVNARRRGKRGIWPAAHRRGAKGSPGSGGVGVQGRPGRLGL